jgi:Ser/Thr protein kinase RdoA (MazF antagonist)
VNGEELDAIRGAVGEAMAPLSKKVDGLAGDTRDNTTALQFLGGRVGELHQAVNGAPGARGMKEAIEGLRQRVDIYHPEGSPPPARQEMPSAVDIAAEIKRNPPKRSVPPGSRSYWKSAVPIIVAGIMALGGLLAAYAKLN